LKESNWYKMKVTGEQDLVPQTEEDIHEIKWMNKKDIPKYFDNAYPSVAGLLKDWLTK